MAGTFRTALKLTGLAILAIVCIQLHISINKPWYRYKLMRLQILTFLQTIMSYGSYYLYRTYKISSLWKKFVVIMIVLTHVSFFAQYMFISDNPSFITIVPFLAFGCHVFMCLGTLCADIGTFLFIPFTMKISVAYQKFKLNFVPVCAIILTLWSYINTILPPQHSTVHVPINGLDPKLNNLHIIHLSDIHVGPTTGKVFVDWLVNEVNTYNPDAVVITGDLVDSSVKNLRNAVWNLKNLKSKYGTFYVTGNILSNFTIFSSLLSSTNHSDKKFEQTKRQMTIQCRKHSLKYSESTHCADLSSLSRKSRVLYKRCRQLVELPA